MFTGTDDDPDTLASLERMGFGDASGVSATVRRWHHGRIQATRSTRARELLTELMPALLRALSHTADPDSAFRKLDEFLAGLPSGVQPFLLLHDNPGLLAQLAEILGSAPRIAEHLSRSPEPARRPHQRRPAPAPAEPRRAARRPRRKRSHLAGDYDDVLDGVRRWQHEREFQVGMQILRGDVAVDQLSGALSDIADTVIESTASARAAGLRPPPRLGAGRILRRARAWASTAAGSSPSTATSTWSSSTACRTKRTWSPTAPRASRRATTTPASPSGSPTP